MALPAIDGLRVDEIEALRQGIERIKPDLRAEQYVALSDPLDDVLLSPPQYLASPPAGQWHGGARERPPRSRAAYSRSPAASRADSSSG